MQKTLLFKISTIAGLCVILAIGLTMISSLVYERQNYAEQVNVELKEQHVSSQEITTPFILMAGVKQVCHNQSIQKKQLSNQLTANISANKSCQSTSEKIRLIAPNQTEAISKLSVSDDTYQRGIYNVTSFNGTINFKQQYNAIHHELTQNNPTQSTKLTNKLTSTSTKQRYLNNAVLLIPISDLRGVTTMPTVKVNDTQLTAKYPSTPIIKDLSYLEVKLPEEISRAETIDIQVTVPIVGMGKIQTIPLGEQFMLSMQSNWHAPNFVGHALPNFKSFDNQGFNASWQNQHLSIKNTQKLLDCMTNHKASEQVTCKQRLDTLNSFDVEFAEPNDVYLQTERSIKYGLLLIAVSFGSFFLFEIIKSLRIHPIQYLLVGMALLVFYVLLLSLAEQIAFWQAYAIAATACAGLIGWYAYFVLESVIRAGLFTLILVVQYAGFFSILTMEEMNLVIGAVLCFILIASVMFLTRRIDWYEVA